LADSRHTNYRLFEGPTLPDKNGSPIMGVAKQLAYETPNGIKVWDATRGGRVARSLGSGNATVGDAMGATLSWCNDPCRTLHFTDVDTGSDTAIPVPAGTSNLNMSLSHFSSNRNLFAVPADNGVVLVDIAGHTAKLAVHDTDFGQYLTVAWGPDGADLYVAGRLIGDTQTMLGRYDTANGKFDVVRLDEGFGSAFVTATNDEVQALAQAPAASPTDCTAPTVQPEPPVARACRINVAAQP
jgi:hypothetical protein